MDGQVLKVDVAIAVLHQGYLPAKIMKENSVMDTLTLLQACIRLQQRISYCPLFCLYSIGFVHNFQLRTFPELWSLLSSFVIGPQFECVYLLFVTLPSLS